MRPCFHCGKPQLIDLAGEAHQTAFGAIGILLPLVDRTGKIEMILGGVFHETNRVSDFHDHWIPGELTELSLSELLEEDG